MSPTNRHLLPEEWDLLIAGTPDERTSAHLNACSECQSIADRLTHDAMPKLPVPARSSYFGAAVLGAVATVIAASVASAYGAGFVRSKQREAALSVQVAQLEAQIASLTEPAGPPIAPGPPGDAVAELKQVRETLRQLQKDAIAVASYKSALAAMKTQLADLEKLHSGDEAALATARANYERSIADSEKKIGDLRAELATTQAKLDASLRTDTKQATSAKDVESGLSQYAETAGIGRVLLTGADSKATDDSGFIAMTADPSSMSAMQKFVAREQFKTGKVYFVGSKTSLETCLPKKGEKDYVKLYWSDVQASTH